MKATKMLLPVAGEPIVTDAMGGRWEYVHDQDDGHNKYLHRSCDAICDRDGRCIMCGRAAPGSLTLQG